MKVSFSLRKDKIDKQGLIPVRMLISHNGIRIRKVVPNVKVKEKDWVKKSQRVKSPLKSQEYNYYIEYNKIIEDLESRVKEIFRFILLNNINPTEDYLLKKIESNEEVHLTFDFMTCFQEFIDKNKSIKAERTIKSYVTTKNFIQDYIDYFNEPLNFEDLDFDFFEKFRIYSFDIKNTKNNYFSKLIGILKTFMSWAFEKEYHTNLNFKKFKASEDETEVIYLTMEELMNLYKFEFDSDRLSHVRDVYCFGCFTGLRFSDLKVLRTSNIFEDHLMLNIVKTKTIGHKVPLNQYSKSILEKYKDTIYEPLPVISSQKFNKYIKECCEKVKITTPTIITRYIGQKIVNKTVPKYEVITSHTARKTFVTNSLILGMKEMIVRNITGHKKEESFRKYVKIAEDFKKQEMDNTWNKI
ncbi:site-specific integrase [Lutibacter sp. A80]|uniref:site-specific integrase n=1 Tax=Lutibacter sp. A80 TaxID=2918453 RepID=UPI001F063E8F|nr:site-specific integrase [Lutibacter sp. A80]UMB59224.1 site-specific integrase [Lutibacter sp. A80]